MQERSSRLKTSPPRVAARFPLHSTRPDKAVHYLIVGSRIAIYDPRHEMSLSYRYGLEIRHETGALPVGECSARLAAATASPGHAR